MDTETHFTFPNLHQAFLKAREGHRTRPFLRRFEFYLERELTALERELATRSYRPRPRHAFAINEPKHRIIYASHFRDRVVHHLLCAVLEPRFEKRFLPVSYACRPGKGNIKAVEDFRDKAARMECRRPGRPLYTLKLDVRKYFDSIPHAKLIELVDRDAPEEELRWLMRVVIRSHETSPGKGLPIGNLTSQVFANLYLHELDFHLVHRLGVKEFLRYMDDLVVLGTDAGRLKSLIPRINGFLRSELDLRLHPDKTYLADMSQGVEFLGYHITLRRCVLKRANVARFKRRLRRFSKSQDALADPKSLALRIRAWCAFTEHAQSRRQLLEIQQWVDRLGNESLSRIVRNELSRSLEKRRAAPAPTQ